MTETTTDVTDADQIPEEVVEAMLRETPIEKATRALLLAGRNSGLNGCGVGARPCRGIAVAQIGCCCDILHYGVNACEKHIKSAVGTVFSMGCEVEVHRIFTAGVDTGLFVGRRDKTRQITQHKSFLLELLEELAKDAEKLPTTENFPDPTEHLKAVVRYAYADMLRDRIERFRNSVEPSKNP